MKRQTTFIKQLIFCDKLLAKFLLPARPQPDSASPLTSHQPWPRRTPLHWNSPSVLPRARPHTQLNLFMGFHNNLGDVQQIVLHVLVFISILMVRYLIFYDFYDFEFLLNWRLTFVWSCRLSQTSQNLHFHVLMFLTTPIKGPGRADSISKYNELIN